jgi:hypothetical protein
MPTLTEGKLKFEFPNGWGVSKYDDWSYYRNQYIKIAPGIKAIDVLALEFKECCWLLEIKDYREHRRTKAIDLADEISEKIRNTLAALVGAQFQANDTMEKTAAKQALRAANLKVVLHLEQPLKHSKLFPRAINPAVVLQRLKQLIKPIDPHPRVVEMSSMPGIPWKVTSL